MAKRKKKPLKVKPRDPFAQHAKQRKNSGPMKNKADKRTNGKNKQQELLDEEV